MYIEYVYTHIYIYMYTYAHSSTNTYIYIYLYICIYVHICVLNAVSQHLVICYYISLVRNLISCIIHAYHTNIPIYIYKVNILYTLLLLLPLYLCCPLICAARCIGQDAGTCVVYGMPRVAQDIGAVEQQLPLAKIGPRLLELATA